MRLAILTYFVFCSLFSWAQRKVEFKYPNGTIKETGTYERGRKDSWWREYDEAGGLKSEALYHLDTILYSRSFYNGKIRFECDNRKHPTFSWFRECNGQGICWRQGYAPKQNGVAAPGYGLDGQFGARLHWTDQGVLHYLTYSLPYSEQDSERKNSVIFPTIWWHKDKTQTPANLTCGKIRLQWHSNGTLAEINWPVEGRTTNIWYRWNDKGQRVDNSMQIIPNDTLKFNKGIANIKLTHTYENGVPHGKWKCLYANGKPWFLCEFKNGVPDGPFECYFPNGKLMAKGVQRDGLCDGVYTEWHSNGMKKVEGEFIWGRRNGKWILYNENGIAIREENFERYKRNGYYRTWKDPYLEKKVPLPAGVTQGILQLEEFYVNDVKEGYLYKYYPTGGLETVTFTNKGYNTGLALQFYPNGKLKREHHQTGMTIEYASNGTPTTAFYQSHDNGSTLRMHWDVNGQPVTAVYSWRDGHGTNAVYKDGKFVSGDTWKDDKKAKEVALSFLSNPASCKLIITGDSVNNKREGVWTYYYPNNRKWMEYHYKDGKLDGQLTVWSIDGNVIEKTNFKNDLLHGQYGYWNHDGVQLELGTWENNLREGEWKRWDKKTFKMVHYGMYHLNEENGVCTNFHADGSPYIISTMKNGVKNGLCSTFHHTKKYLWHEINYINNVKEGPSRIFHPNGVVQWAGNYEFDKQHGVWKEYDSTGKYIGRKIMEYGDLIPDELPGECQCTENYSNTSKMGFYPKLEDQATVEKVNMDMFGLFKINKKTYDRLFYRNYNFSNSSNGGSRWCMMDIIAFDTLAIELTDLPGVKLVFNPCLKGNQYSDTYVNIRSDNPVQGYIRFDEEDTMKTLTYKGKSLYDYVRLSLAIIQADIDSVFLMNLLEFTRTEKNMETEEAEKYMFDSFHKFGLVKKARRLKDIFNALEDEEEEVDEEAFTKCLVRYWFEDGNSPVEMSDERWYEMAGRLNRFLGVWRSNVNAYELPEFMQKTYSVETQLKRIAFDFNKALLTQWDTKAKKSLLIKENTIGARLMYGFTDLGYSSRNGIEIKGENSYCFTPAEIGNTGLILTFTNAGVRLNRNQQNFTEIFPQELAGKLTRQEVGIWVGAGTGEWRDNVHCEIAYQNVWLTGKNIAGCAIFEEKEFIRKNVRAVLEPKLGYYKEEKTNDGKIKVWFLFKIN